MGLLRYLTIGAACSVLLGTGTCAIKGCGGKETRRGLYPESSSFPLGEYRVQRIDYLKSSDIQSKRIIPKYLAVGLDRDMDGSEDFEVFIPPNGIGGDAQMLQFATDLTDRKITVEHYPLEITDREGNRRLLLPVNRFTSNELTRITPKEPALSAD